MLDDSDIHSTRHARALVGGVLAGVIGDTMLYVSGGAERGAWAGGGPIGDYWAGVDASTRKGRDFVGPGPSTIIPGHASSAAA